VNVPLAWTTKVVVAAVVICGTASTVSTKCCVDGVPTPFEAVTVSGKTPPLDGVPERVPVPSPLSVKLTPVGSVPVTASAGVGLPVDVTVKLPGVPAVKVSAAALVIAGAALTVSVKVCAAGSPTPLSADIWRS
jgi:hypothetical protein